jgi:hypothetical protein
MMNIRVRRQDKRWESKTERFERKRARSRKHSDHCSLHVYISRVRTQNHVSLGPLSNTNLKNIMRIHKFQPRGGWWTAFFQRSRTRTFRLRIGARVCTQGQDIISYFFYWKICLTRTRAKQIIFVHTNVHICKNTFPIGEHEIEFRTRHSLVVRKQ